MPYDIEAAKKHWPIIAGGIVAVLILYYILKNRSTAAASTDISGGANAVQSLTAAASMQNAQLNAQTEVAAYSANVANSQVAANLQASLADTAGKVSVANTSTQATLATNLGAQSTMVSLQRILSATDISKTQIEGSTYTSLAKISGQNAVALQNAKNQVALSTIGMIGTQVSTIQKYSKHAASDYQAFAPIIAAESGQGGAAVGLSQAYTTQKIGTSAGSVIAASTPIATSLLTGLFGL